MNNSELNLSLSFLKRYLRKNSITENKIDIIRQHLDKIGEYLPISKRNFRPSQLVRLTINKRIPGNRNDRINSIDFLKSPPESSISRYGRCNLINNSILYGAFTWFTASNELKPQKGDLVTISNWVPKPKSVLSICPIFFKTTSNGFTHNELSFEFKIQYENFINEHYPKAKHAQLNLFMEFLAECFAKEVDEHNHYDYFLSSYLAKIIFDTPNSQIDTIIYPSVQEKLGYSNMAIKPAKFDEAFVLTNVQEVLMSEPGRMNKGTGWAKDFDLEKGLILWYR